MDRALPDAAAAVSGGRVARYAAELDALLAETGAPLPARWPSVEAWLRRHPRVEPWVVLVRSDGGLVAAAVLARHLSVGCWRLGKAGTDGEQSWLAARDPAAAHLLASALRQALDDLGRPWQLALPDLPDSDPVAAELRARLPVCQLRPGPAAPQLRFDPPGGLATYLTRNTRSAVAKAGNRIARAGLAMDIAWLTDPAAVDAALPEVVEVHRRRNRQVRGRSVLDDPAAAGLFRDVVRIHARDGRLRLLTVRIDAALAAFAVCLEDRGTLWVYANLVSPDWLGYSAGTIANAEVVRAAYLDPAIDGVDWGAGVQRYKMSGPVTLRPSQQLLAWSSPGFRLATGLVRASRRPSRPSIQETAQRPR